MLFDMIDEHYDEIVERAHEAFVRQYETDTYITVYINGQTGEPYVLESASPNRMSIEAQQRSDLEVVTYHDYGENENDEPLEDRWDEYECWNIYDILSELMKKLR